MLDVTGNSEGFEAFYTATGVAKTGLAVTVNVRAPDGTLLVTGAAATEVGDGYYTYTLSGALTATAGTYRARFMTADATVDAKDQPSVWICGKPWVQSHPAAAPGAAGGVAVIGSPPLSHLDADVSGVAAGVTVSGYTAGRDPASLMAVAGYTTARAEYLETINPARALTARDQDGVTAPTLDDALVAAWCDAVGHGSQSQTSYTLVKPDNSGPLRTLTLTRDTNGNSVVWD